mmetsp:Transcript_6096/g.23029  ORF Transcript_6096/g.23029 Transcript_6096/m.23029 type:complete len:374 (+) Transcript_6096:669-1790(+)
MRSLSTALYRTARPPVISTTVGYPITIWPNRTPQKEVIFGGVQSTHPSPKSCKLLSPPRSANSRTSRLHSRDHRVQNATSHRRGVLGCVFDSVGCFLLSLPVTLPARPPATPSPTPSESRFANRKSRSKFAGVNTAMSVGTSEVVTSEGTPFPPPKPRETFSRSARALAAARSEKERCGKSLTASPKGLDRFSRWYALGSRVFFSRLFSRESVESVFFSRSSLSSHSSLASPSSPPMVNTKVGSRVRSASGSIFVSSVFSFSFFALAVACVLTGSSSSSAVLALNFASLEISVWLSHDAYALLPSGRASSVTNGSIESSLASRVDVSSASTTRPSIQSTARWNQPTAGSPVSAATLRSRHAFLTPRLTIEVNS